MIFLWLAACTGSTADTSDTTLDTSDTWTYRGDVAVDTLSLGCADDAWSLSARNTGWADSAVLVFTDPEGVLPEESHALSGKPASWDPDGAWELRTLTLSVGTFSEGSSTGFACESAPNLTWRLLDASGNTLDCRVWGPSPDTESGCSSL